MKLSEFLKKLIEGLNEVVVLRLKIYFHFLAFLYSLRLFIFLTGNRNLLRNQQTMLIISQTETRNCRMQLRRKEPFFVYC